MKIHGLAIAALVLLILGGLLYWSEHHKPAETSKISADTPPSILKLDQSSITKLELKKKDAEPIQLTKASSGDWQITAPKPLRADQSTVSGILSSLSSLNSERLVEDKASDLKPFGLETPLVEVNITAKDNKSQKLLLGDDTPAGSGVYAALAGDPRVFTVASYTKTTVDKGLNDLRDKRLLTVAADKVSRVELARKNEDIEFGRNKDDWQILKPKPMRADNTQVADLVRELTDAKMDISGSDAGDAAGAFAKAAPVATARVTDASGAQELQIRKIKEKDKETYYAKSSAVDGAYKVDSSVGKAVDKGLEDFRNKKLFDFGYNDPNKIELHNGSKAYFLTRGSGGSQDWWSSGKKMDPDSVDTFISKLRDLAATKFPDLGFSNPAIDLYVATDDGKRTEKVLIAKSGDHYLAHRENEPALYQLDASGIDDLLKAADEIKPASGSQAMSKKP
jgi:Domain of unknown function (DUF4340)